MSVRSAAYAPAAEPSPARQVPRPQKISLVVWGALVANVLIALSKYVAAAATGSSAMLSEAIHSTADTGNELLLMLGVRLSRRAPTRGHPFGRGQEVYFWGLIVAMVLFALGGGLSVYEGIHHIQHPRPIENATWSYVVLGCAFVFEGASFAIACRKMRQIARAQGISFLQAAHFSKDPQDFVVLFEDAAALLGIVVGFVGVYASHVFEAPVIDGVASIVIGAILTAASLFLAYECRSLLIGESADWNTVCDIRALVLADEAVDAVADPLTLQLGPQEILLNLAVDFRDALDAHEVEVAVDRLTCAIRARHPDVQHIYLSATSLKRPRARLPDAT